MKFDQLNCPSVFRHVLVRIGNTSNSLWLNITDILDTLLTFKNDKKGAIACEVTFHHLTSY